MKTLLKTKQNLKAMIGLFYANYNNKDQTLYFDQFDDILAYFQKNGELQTYFQKLSNMPSLDLWHQTTFENNLNSPYDLYIDDCNEINACESKNDLYEFLMNTKNYFTCLSNTIDHDLETKKDEIEVLSKNIKNTENHLNALKESMLSIREFSYDFEHALSDIGFDSIIDKIENARDYIKESVYDSTLDKHDTLSAEYKSMIDSKIALLNFVNDVYLKEIENEIDSCVDDEIFESIINRVIEDIEKNS